MRFKKIEANRELNDDVEPSKSFDKSFQNMQLKFENLIDISVEAKIQIHSEKGSFDSSDKDDEALTIT